MNYWYPRKMRKYWNIAIEVNDDKWPNQVVVVYEDFEVDGTVLKRRKMIEYKLTDFISEEDITYKVTNDLYGGKSRFRNKRWIEMAEKTWNEFFGEEDYKWLHESIFKEEEKQQDHEMTL